MAGRAHSLPLKGGGEGGKWAVNTIPSGGHRTNGVINYWEIKLAKGGEGEDEEEEFASSSESP